VLTDEYYLHGAAILAAAWIGLLSANCFGFVDNSELDAAAPEDGIEDSSALEVHIA
jgi:hypothetical protein